MAPSSRMQQRPPEATEFTVVSDREVRMERVFGAPPAAVFKAYTDPKQIPQWWGPRGQSTRVDAMDVRPGGKWRFVHTSGDGEESAFRGEYREVAPDRHLVHTFEFEPWAGRISIDDALFVDEGGKTRLIVTSTFTSRDDRDAMLDSGMKQGAKQTWDRLADLVEKPRTSFQRQAIQEEE